MEDPKDQPIKKRYDITGGVRCPSIDYLHKVFVKDAVTGERLVFINAAQPVTKDE